MLWLGRRPIRAASPVPTHSYSKTRRAVRPVGTLADVRSGSIVCEGVDEIPRLLGDGETPRVKRRVTGVVEGLEMLHVRRVNVSGRNGRVPCGRAAACSGTRSRSRGSCRRHRCRSRIRGQAGWAASGAGSRWAGGCCASRRASDVQSGELRVVGVPDDPERDRRIRPAVVGRPRNAGACIGRDHRSEWQCRRRPLRRIEQV